MIRTPESARIRINSSHGAILVVALFSIITILTVLAATIAISRRTILRSDLASIADSAALAGAEALGSSRGCLNQPATADCSSLARWNRVPDLVVAAVKGGALPSGLSDSAGNSLNSLTCQPTSDSPVRCGTPSGGLEVIVERGSWRQPRPATPGAPTEPKFFPLDDPTAFRAEFPGLPYLVAFNAIRVTVTGRPSSAAAFSPLIGANLAATRVSIATVASDRTVPIAPFAIPVCSVLKSGPTPELSSNLSLTDICVADRLMAPISRYCPAGETTCRGVVPQFAWDPSFFTPAPMAGGDDRTDATNHWKPVDFRGPPGTTVPAPGDLTGMGPSIPSISTGDSFCFWGSPRYLEPEDNFGFVAGPCAANGSNETTEDLIIGSENSTDFVRQASARLGSKLCPLPGGFSTIRAKDAVWKMVIGKYPNPLPEAQPTPNNPRFDASNSYLGGLGVTAASYQNIHRVFNLNPSQIPATIPTACASMSTTPSPPQSTTPPRPRWPRTWNRMGPTVSNELGYQDVPALEGGTCNSIRTGWGFWSSFPATGGVNWMVGRAPPFADISPSENLTGLKFWSGWAAVVADTSADAAPCLGVDPAASSITADPKIVPKEYEIVGYLRLQIYDLDISDPPPAFPPRTGASPILTSSSTFPFPSVRACGVDDPYSPCSAAPGPTPTAILYPTVPGGQPLYRWWFDRPDAPRVGTNPPTSCNLVRTRLSCEQPPVPSAGGIDGVVPLRLVRDSASQAMER